MSHVTQDGNVPVDHQNTHDEIGYEVLLTKLGKEWGWANKTAYEFTLNYRTNHIRIDIAGGNFGAGQTIFELDGTFEEGRFGFYNRSQGNVRYEGFTQKCISDAPVSTNFEAGVFTVGNTGIVKIDWLFDGGVYQGELGIFSLSSMENLEPNSPEFIAEAVKRALSNSELGYIVLSDPTEGARFSGTLGNSSEPDRNSGVYKGLKSFKMKQGDKFATILVPNSTFNELAKNPGTENTHVRPIFSISSPNPEDRLYFGQLAKIHDIGNAFVFEDMLLSSNSDRDYNDLIIQIKGATVYAPTLDNPALGLKNDWRQIDNPVIPHIAVSPPGPGTLWITITLKSPADLIVYDPDGRYIGKEGGYIPGATLEYDENGHQVVTIPAIEFMDLGDYRIVLQGKGEGGLCHLEVKGFMGDTEISSKEVPFEIQPHQTLATNLSAENFVENQTVEFEAPEAPVSADGKLLLYDFDGDGDIDIADIMKLASIWDSCKDDDDYDAFYDLDNSGCIRLNDIMKVVNSEDKQ